MSETGGARPGGLRVAVAFAAVYLVWGSTYLAIRWGLASFPPFVLAGLRFLLAGGALAAWTLGRGTPTPTARHWRSAAVLGGLMLFGGNASVVWATTRVPSGLVAVLVAFVPLWVALLSYVVPGGRRPGPAGLAGVIVGLAGIALLVGPGAFRGRAAVDPLAAAALAAGSLSWAWGTLLAPRVPLPASPLLATGMQMLCGGVFMSLAGLATGEWPAVRWGALAPGAVASLAYLVVFGSIVAFTAYIWLLGRVPATRVSTYAFVNPVVAVALGWALGGEALEPRTLVAASLVIGAVALIVLSRPAAAGPRGGAGGPGVTPGPGSPAPGPRAGRR